MLLYGRNQTQHCKAIVPSQRKNHGRNCSLRSSIGWDATYGTAERGETKEGGRCRVFFQQSGHRMTACGIQSKRQAWRENAVLRAFCRQHLTAWCKDKRKVGQHQILDWKLDSWEDHKIELRKKKKEAGFRRKTRYWNPDMLNSGGRGKQHRIQNPSRI